MALNIFSIEPQTGSLDVAIDSKITIEFDQPIDPTTVPYGVSVYVLSEGLWTGPELSILDSKYSDVLDNGEEFTYMAYDYEVLEDGVKLVITPKKGFLPNRKTFIQVLPGNDPERYLSARTSGVPAYTRVASSTGEIFAKTPYLGETDLYTFAFSKSASGVVDTVDVTKGATYIGGYKFQEGVDLVLEDITIGFKGYFDADDLVELDVYKAYGTQSVYKTMFTTNEYNTIAPSSHKIETLEQVYGTPLLLADVTPSHESMNNNKMNPIVMKFSKPLDKQQDLLSLIKITKVDMESGEEKRIKFAPVVQGNVLKLYLNAVE